MKHNVVFLVSVLLLTLVCFTEVNAADGIRMGPIKVAIGEFQSGTVKQTGVLTDLLIDSVEKHYHEQFKIVTTNNAIKSAISRYKSEMSTGTIPKQSAINSEKISADLLIIPKIERFGDTYILTVNFLDLKTFFSFPNSVWECLS